MLLVAQIGGEVAAEGAALFPPDIPLPDAVRHLCFEVEALAVGIKIIVQRVVQLVAVHAQQLVAAGEAERRAKEMLDYFRLQEELWDIYPQTFSGGERLRLNLAHAMVKRPRLMLLDEPTASLDNKTKVLVKDILQQLKEEKTSMLGIFHDLEFMEGVCDKVFNMSEGSFA